MVVHSAFSDRAIAPEDDDDILFICYVAAFYLVAVL